MAAALGVCALLLLAGTELVSWYWPVAIFALALVAGVWKARTMLPDHYRIAQLLDNRLGFSDSLSTAFYFGTAAAEIPAPVRDSQARQAEDMARTADLRSALPFTFPRGGYATAAFGLAVLTIFGIRYGITRSLDLKRPMIAGAFESFFSPPTEIAQNPTGPRKTPFANDLEKLGVPVNNPDTQMQEGLDAGSDAATNTVETPDVNANPGAESGNNDSPKTPAEGAGKDEEGSEDQQAGSGKGQQAETNGSESKSQEDQPQGDKGAKQQQGNDSKSDLLDKMKDALSNMLNKMKTQPKGDQQQQKASNSKEGNPSGKGQKSDKQGQQQDGQQQQQAGEGQDQKADAKGENGQKSDKSQGKSGEQQGQQQSADAKSGMGKQDGQKDVKDAETQAAMGKISEIFGKRQQNLTGEVLIEVSSGKQQLKTAYSSQNGSHRESGGEIHRDEVPLLYQQYVERYFEQVRRPEGVRLDSPQAGKAGSTATSNGSPRLTVPQRPGSATPGASQ